MTCSSAPVLIILKSVFVSYRQLKLTPQSSHIVWVDANLLPICYGIAFWSARSLIRLRFRAISWPLQKVKCEAFFVFQKGLCLIESFKNFTQIPRVTTDLFMGYGPVMDGKREIRMTEQSGQEQPLNPYQHWVIAGAILPRETA